MKQEWGGLNWGEVKQRRGLQLGPLFSASSPQIKSKDPRTVTAGVPKTVSQPSIILCAWEGGDSNDNFLFNEVFPSALGNPQCLFPSRVNIGSDSVSHGVRGRGLKATIRVPRSKKVIYLFLPQSLTHRSDRPMPEMIRGKSAIGQLSKVSREEGDDQRLPPSPRSTRNGSGVPRPGAAMIETCKTVTVEEHFRDHQVAATPVTTPDMCTYTSQGVANRPGLERPTSSKDLYRLVRRIYEQGSRSPQLIGLVRRTASAIPMRIATATADYVMRTWERRATASATESIDDPGQSLLNVSPASIGALTNFIACLLHRAGPSVVVVMLAAYYVGRLRRLFPRAHGEPGCGHRLFTVALLIAYRYHQRTGSVDSSFYCAWSANCGGIFAAADLARMEAEFVLFLGGDLYISSGEFEYFVDQVYGTVSGEGGGQVVPHSLDIVELARPAGTVLAGDDASVPSLFLL